MILSNIKEKKICTLAQCGQYPALDDFSFTPPKVVIKRHTVNIKLKGTKPVKIG